MAKPSVAVNIRLPLPIAERLDNAAAAKLNGHETKTDIVIAALEAYLPKVQEDKKEETPMQSKTSEHYERTGDKLTGDDATKAYRAAQNHLQGHDAGYMDDAKRLQGKIIESLDRKEEK